MMSSSNAVPGYTFVNEINYFSQVICRTPEFFETLFVITVMWDQPKCSSLDKCIRNNTYTNSHTYSRTHMHICVCLGKQFRLKMKLICHG